MELVAEIKGKKLTLYAEGLSDTRLFGLVKGERVCVHLLVFTNERGSTYHDDNYTSPILAFCHQELTTPLLRAYIKDAGFNQPTELEFGNELFHVQQYFPNAYRLTFHSYQQNESFRKFILKLYRTKKMCSFINTIRKRGKASTDGFKKEYADIPLEKFAAKRFDQWHDCLVAEYEKALANGAVHCAGCEDSVPT